MNSPISSKIPDFIIENLPIMKTPGPVGFTFAFYQPLEKNPIQTLSDNREERIYQLILCGQHYTDEKQTTPYEEL